jgi:hypothetical protein
MTTKLAGGKITGLLALTCEAQYAAEIGDPVMVTGPYEVSLMDGSRPLLGHISVANKGRVGGTFPAAITPGQCTVEALGFYVRRAAAGADIAAGLAVGYSAGGLLVPRGSGVNTGTNEVQTLSRTSTAGTFTLTFDGEETATISASAAGFTAAAVEAALEALDNLVPADVTVAGSAGGPLTVTFSGTYAGTNVAMLVVDDALATGGDVTVAETTPGDYGAADSYNGIALTASTDAGDTLDVLFR